MKENIICLLFSLLFIKISENKIYLVETESHESDGTAAVKEPSIKPSIKPSIEPSIKPSIMPSSNRTAVVKEPSIIRPPHPKAECSALEEDITGEYHNKHYSNALATRTGRE